MATGNSSIDPTCTHPAPAADLPLAYLASDRLEALAQGRELPTRTFGAGLFADVSGFVSVSTRLAREYGAQRGAEELTALLDRAIGAAIDEIARYGGSVVYFSGDAITCWFDGDDATPRAAAAALAAVEAVASTGRFTTGAGQEIALQLKCAVATGPAQRFVVGNPQIQLIDVLAGHVLTELAEIEQVAHPGEVLLADAACLDLGELARTGERRATQGSGATVLTGLRDGVAPVADRVHAALPEAVVRPWLLPVVYERLRAGRGEFVAELRSAVPMFIRFSGIDFEDDAEAPARLHDFVTLTQDVLSAHGGNVLQLTLGDKGAYLYGVFGSPQAHGDDPARAAAAALDLQEAARRSGVRDVQIGLTYGRVRSGTYGHRRRRTFVCLGPPVNLAARLMSGAPGGAIHATADLVEATSAVFTWTPVGTRQVKGVPEPVEIFALRNAAGHRTSGRERPLVGRAAELGILHDALTASAHGEGTCVVVQGEAGYGKSRLVAEAAARAQAAGALVATGEAALTNRRGSYILWHGALRRLLALGDVGDPGLVGTDRDAHVLAAVAALLPEDTERAALLGPLLGVDLTDSPLTATMDAKLRKASREDLVCRLVSRIASRQPLVIVLEDADRADPLSRGLLDEVVRACAQDPVCLVVTTRLGDLADTVWSAHPRLTRIRLDPLGAADADALLVARLHETFGPERPLAPALVAQLADRAQGNPFYIEQLVGFLASKGIDPADPSAWRTLELPASMHSLVLEKLDTMAEGPRRAVKVASVFGRHFDHTILPQAYPELGAPLGVRRDLGPAVAAELVEADPDREGAWRFRHAVVQEVAYESVPFDLRTQLHGRIAATLETLDPYPVGDALDLVTHHWWHSDNVPKQRDFLGRAADAARERYANETAVEYYQRLTGLSTGVARAKALRGMGQVRELTGAWDAAEAAYQEAISLTEDDADLQAWCRTHLADAVRRQGRFAEADQALSLARTGFEAIHDVAGEAQVFHLRGTLAAQQGDYVGARASYEQSLALRPAQDDSARASTLSNLGVVAEYEGDLEGAREYHEQALALREERGDLWAISVSKTGLGMISMLQHDPQRAHVDFEEAMRLGQAVGDPWMIAISHNNIGNADRDLGEYDRAMTHYAAAASRYADSDDLWSLAFLLEDAAVCRAAQENARSAATLLGAADRCRSDLGSPRPDSLEAELTARLAPAIAELGDAGWAAARAAGQQIGPADAGSVLSSGPLPDGSMT